MKKTLKMTALTTGLLLSALTSNAHADYVVDGDFSNPYVGSDFTTYTAGQTFGAWTVTDGSVGFSGSVDSVGGYWQSPTGPGTGSVDLDGNSPGAISQTINTGIGSFFLTFSLSGNPDGGNALKSLGVSVGNVISDVFNYTTGANTRDNMKYATETLEFTSTTASTNLVFASLDAANSPYGAVIGNISVSAVPLPAGMPMFVAALLAMIGFRSYRKRQQLA